MRAHHAILLLVAISIGVLAKQLIWPGDQAVAVDVQQIQHDNRNLPAQNVDDKTFVFDGN
jgi:hypothetical protein